MLFVRGCTSKFASKLYAIIYRVKIVAKYPSTLDPSDPLCISIRRGPVREEIRAIHQAEQIATLGPDLLASLENASQAGLTMFDPSLVINIRTQVGDRTDELCQSIRLNEDKLAKLSDKELEARLALDLILDEGLSNTAFLLREHIPKRKYVLENFISKLDLATLYEAINSGYHPGLPSRVEWLEFIYPLRQDYDDLLLLQANNLGFSSCPDSPYDISNDEIEDHREDNLLAMMIARPIENEPQWLKPLLRELFNRGFVGDHNGTSLDFATNLFLQRYQDIQGIINIIDSSKDGAKILLNCILDDDLRSQVLSEFTKKASQDRRFATALCSSILTYVSRNLFHHKDLVIDSNDNDLLSLPAQLGPQAITAICRMEEGFSLVYSSLGVVHPYNPDDDPDDSFKAPNKAAYKRMLELFLSQHDMARMRNQTATVLLTNLGLPCIADWACNSDNERLRHNSWLILSKSFADAALNEMYDGKKYANAFAMLDKAISLNISSKRI